MITHASLFSGIGAADLAAEELGWRNVFNCEINEFCRRVLDYHFPDADKYKDIYKVNFRKYEGTINVLSGGFPCQAFSVAGRRRGTEDDRYLWPQMLRAITEIKPDYVLGENVVGILSMVSSIGEPQVAHQASLFGEGDNIVTQRGQYVADIIREDLEREGYTLQIFVIPACAIGAPHQRNRVWFIAKRNATDPINNGLQYNVERGCEGEMFGTQGERRQNGISEQVKPTATTGKGWSIADPKSQQGNRCESGEPTDCRPGQGKFGGGDCKVCDDWQRPIAHTDICGDRTQEAHNRTKASRGGNNVLPCERGEEAERVNGCGVVQPPDIMRKGLERVAGLRIQESERRGVIGELGRFTPCRSSSRWRGFPTTEPVIRRGDDGISERMDSSTISFARWRREAIKAYGNSMVMPLVKEIFKAIQKDIEHDREI